MSTNFDQLKPTSFAARDWAAQQDQGDLQKMLDDAMAASTRSGSQMVSEVKSAIKSPGKISKVEYVRYRMYELSKKERKEFISDRLAWPIDGVCGDPEWSDKTVDKFVCTQVLTEAGLPTIPITAMVNRTGGSYDGTTTISTADEMHAFLSTATLPLFAKPNELLGSFGAFVIESFDGTTARISGGEEVTPAQLLDDVIADEPYVFQQVIANHESIRKYATGLATIRTVNFVSPGSVRMPYAVYKIPGGDNIADNFWRDGNLLADIDVETGVIRRVVSGTGPNQQEHTVHPTTGEPMVGETLPFWDQVLELNKRCSEVFGAIRYQTQDIALTDDGPIIVEVNSGGSFDLPQVATGRGLLTEDNRKFFESCGFNFRKIKPQDVGLN